MLQAKPKRVWIILWTIEIPTFNFTPDFGFTYFVRTGFRGLRKFVSYTCFCRGGIFLCTTFTTSFAKSTYSWQHTSIVAILTISATLEIINSSTTFWPLLHSSQSWISHHILSFMKFHRYHHMLVVFGKHTVTLASRTLIIKLVTLVAFATDSLL